jgi:hypothetical protein
VLLWFPVDGVAAARVTGHIRAGIAVAAYAEIDRYATARTHPGRGFVDFSGMSEFEWDARAVMMRWNIAHRKQATRLDVLSGSWMTHSVLTALGTVLGHRLVSHADRLTFEAAYATTIRPRG